MYPQYWTLSIGGIFMKCSYECKRMCVELYREGGRPETPEGLKESNFRCRARKLVRMEEACGPEVLQHKEQNKRYAGLVQQIKEKSKERKKSACGEKGNAVLSDNQTA